MHLNVPALQGRFYRMEAVVGGRDFIFHNDADKVVFRAQMTASIFTLLLLVIAFLAAREMFGTTAGLIALGLLVFDPTLLAHGALVTTDSAQACFLLASIYAFYRYAKAPSVARLVITGIAVGLALASKHSAVVIIAMLAILAVMELFVKPLPESTEPHRPLGKLALRYAVAIVAISVIGLTILWSVYGFRYSARENRLQLNAGTTFQGSDSHGRQGARRIRQAPSAA